GVADFRRGGEERHFEAVRRLDDGAEGLLVDGLARALGAEAARRAEAERAGDVALVLAVELGHDRGGALPGERPQVGRLRPRAARRAEAGRRFLARLRCLLLSGQRLLR